MKRFKCETCMSETFGSNGKFCHGQMMTDMGEWVMEKKEILHAPMIVRAATYQYQCPITGREVNGKRDHERNLAEHGCRLLEPGEREDAERRKKHAADALDRQLDSGIDHALSQMGDEKVNQLVNELSTT